MLSATTIAHGPPRHRNTALQGRLADKALWPELLEQFLPWDHAVMVLHQIRQHREHLLIEPDHLCGSAQLVALHIQRIGPKDVAHDLVLLWHTTILAGARARCSTRVLPQLQQVTVAMTW
jgi:hypothetical protein